MSEKIRAHLQHLPGCEKETEGACNCGLSAAMGDLLALERPSHPGQQLRLELPGAVVLAFTIEDGPSDQPGTEQLRVRLRDRVTHQEYDQITWWNPRDPSSLYRAVNVITHLGAGLVKMGCMMGTGRAGGK